MFDAEAAYGWAKMCQDWAEKATLTRTKLFNDALSNWRQNAIVLRSLGKPLPQKPEPPELVACDVEKAKQRYIESLRSGEPINQDYFTYTTMPVAADAFDLDEKSKPQPADPISQVDPSTTGRWNIASGDRTPKGTMLSVAFPHLVAKYGLLKRMATNTGFGGAAATVHFWQAASNDPVAHAIWQKAVDKVNGVVEEDEESWTL